MEETKRRSQRMKCVIKFCGVRQKALRTGYKRAKDLISVERLMAAREREEREREAYIESLRKQLSPREIATVREREERERELYTPRKRPRARRRWPESGSSIWRPGSE